MNEPQETTVTFRTGTLALAGAPNAGKSTLLNHVLGQKVSIVSDKPQTTRNRVAGILNEPDLQIVLLDTPGIHDASRNPLNAAMVRLAESTLHEVDAICWVIDAARAASGIAAGRPPLAELLEHIGGLVEGAGVPVIVALNKVDRAEKLWLLPLIAAVAERLPDATVVPISALKGVGIDTLIEAWRAVMPIGEAQYPPDQLMLDAEKTVVAELIREQIFRLTEQEVPYSAAVEIEKFDESDRDNERPGVEIFARITVERDSQKGILIGKRGAMLKRIGIAARAEMEALLGAHVFLHLHVSVNEGWTRDPRALRRMGLG